MLNQPPRLIWHLRTYRVYQKKIIPVNMSPIGSYNVHDFKVDSISSTFANAFKKSGF
jgi:hypothetical protein